MHNRCYASGCFLNNSSKAHAHELATLMFCATLLSCGHLLFTWKIHCSLKFHFGHLDRSEICTEESFTTPEVMWTQIMKLSHTEVKFYPEVKSQTGLSSLWVSCKLTLSILKSRDRPWTDRTEQYASKEYIKWNKERKNIHSRFQEQ